MSSESERAELDHLRASLGAWALGDVKKSVAGGVKVGAFILGANLIDVLARLACSKTSDNGRAAWDEFVLEYLKRYDGHANTLYKGFRGAVSHNYSLDGIRLTDGPEYSDRHWTIEEGERVLHLETFVEDLESAFEAFCERVEGNAELRERVLGRVRNRPLLGVVGGDDGRASASLATSITLASQATYFGHSGAHAATGSTWPPRMDIPKGKRPNRK
jgi:hypothetical protein